MDRRKFPRADYPCKVTVLTQKHKETFDTHTENIGEGGVCVILDKELKRFTMAGLILYLKNGQPPMECDGRVVWAVVRNKSEYDTGIEFINLKEEYRLRIARIVGEFLKES